MAEKDYKVEAYPVRHKAVDQYDHSYTETRYRVVDLDGKVLDDAQGYGYKTAQNAHAAWGYKSRPPAKKKQDAAMREKVIRWLKAHKDFAQAMDQFAWEIRKGSWGPDQRFDAKFVKQMLKDNELEIDFSVRNLLKYWSKFDC